MLTILKEHVIDIPVVEKLVQLQELGKNPMCLFQTEKSLMCCANEEMLRNLESEVHVIPCTTNEVDETRSTAKWHQKAAKQSVLPGYSLKKSTDRKGYHRHP